MNGCRGGSGTATGCCAAGWPENTGSEPAAGPSGIGCGGTAAAARGEEEDEGGGEDDGLHGREGSREGGRGGAGYCTARRLAVARRSVRSPLAGRTA